MRIELDTDERLEELLDGKDVVLVGPAPYLKGSGRGEEFDSADVVVRANSIMPIRSLRKDYGSRVDIYTCNFGTPWMPGIKRRLSLDDNMEHFKNLKMVIGTAIRGTHGDNIFSDNYISPIPKNFDSINEYNLPFYWIGKKDYKQLYSAIGVEFNTGIASICLLMNYSIRSLKISGFTFYLEGNTYQDLYCEGHMDKLDYSGRKFGIDGGHGRHATLKQIDFVRNLFASNQDTIILDEEIIKLLGI